jgi:uncharacterized membrane protein YkoI
MKTLIKPFIFIAATAGLAIPAAALADQDDIRLLAETRITLIEAIEIAQNHQGGQAYEATLDDDRFAPEYEVNVVVDNVSYEVTVDGVTGEVRNAKEDRDD